MRFQDLATAHKLTLGSQLAQPRVCPVHRNPDDAASRHGNFVILTDLPTLKLSVLQFGDVSHPMLCMYYSFTDVERQLHHLANSAVCCYCSHSSAVPGNHHFCVLPVDGRR